MREPDDDALYNLDIETICCQILSSNAQTLLVSTTRTKFFKKRHSKQPCIDNEAPK